MATAIILILVLRDEMENIQEGSYCVWRPKTTDLPSPSRSKKRKSTGATLKGWKLQTFSSGAITAMEGQFRPLDSESYAEKMDQKPWLLRKRSTEKNIAADKANNFLDRNEEQLRLYTSGPVSLYHCRYNYFE